MSPPGSSGLSGLAPTLFLRGIPGSISIGAQAIDFRVARKPSGRPLREGENAVDDDLEGAAAADGQLDLGAVARDQAVPRTEGSRLIVSRPAIFDPHLHHEGLPEDSVIATLSSL
jgi:hypothetical protein